MVRYVHWGKSSAPSLEVPCGAEKEISRKVNRSGSFGLNKAMFVFLLWLVQGL